MITYLPSIYGTFSRRETQVAMLEVRAGDPPSAVEMLARHHRIGWLGDMDGTWIEWEQWFAELEDFSCPLARRPGCEFDIDRHRRSLCCSHDRQTGGEENGPDE